MASRYFCNSNILRSKRVAAAQVKVSLVGGQDTSHSPPKLPDDLESIFMVISISQDLGAKHGPTHFASIENVGTRYCVQGFANICC